MPQTPCRASKAGRCTVCTVHVHAYQGRHKGRDSTSDASRQLQAGADPCSHGRDNHIPPRLDAVQTWRIDSSSGWMVAARTDRALLCVADSAALTSRRIPHSSFDAPRYAYRSETHR
jgi:hypothetical protein